MATFVVATLVELSSHPAARDMVASLLSGMLEAALTAVFVDAVLQNWSVRQVVSDLDRRSRAPTRDLLALLRSMRRQRVLSFLGCVAGVAYVHIVHPHVVGLELLALLEYWLYLRMRRRRDPKTINVEVRYLINNKGGGPPAVVKGMTIVLIVFTAMSWLLFSGQREVGADLAMVAAPFSGQGGHKPGGRPSSDKSAGIGSVAKPGSAPPGRGTVPAAVPSPATGPTPWKCGGTRIVAEQLENLGMGASSAEAASRAADLWGNYLDCPATVSRIGQFWELPVGSPDGPSLIVVNPVLPTGDSSYPRGVPVDADFTPIVEAELYQSAWVFPRVDFGVGVADLLESTSGTCSVYERTFSSAQLIVLPPSVTALILSRAAFTGAVPVLTGSQESGGVVSYSFVDVLAERDSSTGYLRSAGYSVAYARAVGTATLSGTVVTDDSPCPSATGLLQAAEQVRKSIYLAQSRRG